MLTHILAGAIGSLIGFVLAAILSGSKEETHDYLNHEQNDEFTEQL